MHVCYKQGYMLHNSWELANQFCDGSNRHPASAVAQQLHVADMVVSAQQNQVVLREAIADGTDAETCKAAQLTRREHLNTASRAGRCVGKCVLCCWALV